MSLSQHFQDKQVKHINGKIDTSTPRIEKKCLRVLAAISTDIATLRERAEDPHNHIAKLKPLHGKVKKNNTQLSYEIKSPNLPDRRQEEAYALVAAFKEMITTHDAFLELHRLCASPEIDVKLEIRAFCDRDLPFFAFSFVNVPTITIDLYLSQPYTASSQQLGRPATTPAPAKPVQPTV